MAKKIKKKITTITEEIISDERTHIICILDRSGSMSNIINDTVGGFNTFLNTQKELPDEATITVALFDDKYELLYDFVDIKKVDEITKKQWNPRGLTSLYDAIGITITNDKDKMDKLGDEKPDKVLVCVVTDGLENSSKEYNNESIKKLISECEKLNWNFMYLAANQDAFNVGQSFGISGGNTFTYTANSTGVMDMMDVMATSTASYRSMSSTDVSFNDLSKSLIDEK